MAIKISLIAKFESMYPYSKIICFKTLVNKNKINILKYLFTVKIIK